MILGYYVGKRPEFKIQVSCVPLLFFIAAFEAEGLPFFFFSTAPSSFMPTCGTGFLSLESSKPSVWYLGNCPGLSISSTLSLVPCVCGQSEDTDRMWHQRMWEPKPSGSKTPVALKLFSQLSLANKPQWIGADSGDLQLQKICSWKSVFV